MASAVMAMPMVEPPPIAATARPRRSVRSRPLTGRNECPQDDAVAGDGPRRQAQRQERHADAEQGRGDEGLVVDRDRRHAFGASTIWYPVLADCQKNSAAAASSRMSKPSPRQ